MAVQVSYPGVYIEEFAPGAPIQGVSTSTPAFIGIAATGELNVPTFLTSWDTFRSTYGQQPVPGFFLWYAVRGFFENGGQVCYVVRASNGAYDKLSIVTRAGAQALWTVRARNPGTSGVSVQIDTEHLLDSTKTSLYQPTGALKAVANGGDRQLVMSAADSAQFRPGDNVTVAATGEHLQIMRISSDGTNGTLLLGSALAGGHAIGDKVRMDDTMSGAQVFRLVSSVAIPTGALVQGTMLTFTQGAKSNTQIVDAVQTEFGPTKTYRVTMRQGLSFPVDMTTAATVQSEEFKISVKQGTGIAPYDGLASDSAHPNYYLNIVNGDLNGLILIEPLDPPPPVGMPGNLPAAIGMTALSGGAVEDLTTLVDQNFIDALDALHGVADVNMIAVPDRPSAAVQQAVIAQCELLADRFGVLDCRPGLAPFRPTDSQQQRAETARRAATRRSTTHGCAYRRSAPGAPILVPPSGHVCGIYARVDTTRGVHKAPANEIINGALGLERVLVRHRSWPAQPRRHQCRSRVFQAGGRPVLLARAPPPRDTNWQYVNIRRLFLYLEKSIQAGHSRGPCSSRTTRPCGKAQALDRRFPRTQHGATARSSAPRPKTPSTCGSTRC